MQINDFLCLINSRNTIPLFHRKVISHNPLQEIYLNLARTFKNKIYYGITDRGSKKPPHPMSDSVKIVAIIFAIILFFGLLAVALTCCFYCYVSHPIFTIA